MTAVGSSLEACWVMLCSNAGALLLGATDRAIGLVKRFAACFRDSRRADLVEHEVRTLLDSGCLAWRWATRTSSTTIGYATIRSWRCVQS